VAPLYARHRYDGTITNTIVYPLTRALYGQRIRQPIGGDFGFAGSLAASFLAFDDWEGPVSRYGIDIFMSTTALVEKRRVCQSFLGAKIHDAKDPGADLQPMMVQVVSTLFELMERHVASWWDVAGSEKTPVFGFPYTVGLEPVPIRLERLMTLFRQAVAELMPVWDGFLSPRALAAIREAALGTGPPRLSDEAWVEIIYDAAAGWRHRRLGREDLIRAIVPLYLGKVATFVAETRDGSGDEAEERLEALAQTYEGAKDLLRAKWNASAPHG